MVLSPSSCLCLSLSVTHPNTLWILQNKKQLVSFKIWPLEMWSCGDGAAEGERSNTPGVKVETLKTALWSQSKRQNVPYPQSMLKAQGQKLLLLLSFCVHVSPCRRAVPSSGSCAGHWHVVSMLHGPRAATRLQNLGKGSLIHPGCLLCFSK